MKIDQQVPPFHISRLAINLRYIKTMPVCMAQGKEWRDGPCYQKQLLGRQGIYNYQTSMQVTSERHQLPSILSKLYRKRSALVFSKLILYQEEAWSDSPVRHYDYQCQGLAMLSGLFRKKQQTVLMKGFACIRAVAQPNKKRSANSNRIIYPASMHNTPSTKGGVNCLRVPLGDAARSSRKANSENSLALSNARSTASRLEGILSRLKEINSASQLDTTSKKPQRLNAQNSTVYIDGSRYRQLSKGGTANNLETFEDLRKHYSARDLSGKRSKKWLILRKLADLESNFSEMDYNEPQNTSMNYLAIPNETAYFRQALHTVQANQ